MNTWAVIKTGGKQYKVSEGETLDVEKISLNGESESVSFSEVLLIAKDDQINLGKPLIAKAKVKAKVLKNFKDKKIKVVKFKSKSRYLRTQGHRQQKTKVFVEKISS